MAGLIILSSCSSSQKGMATASRDDVKGTWLLNDITYDGITPGQNIKLTLLDEGDENCLKGSTWVFLTMETAPIQFLLPLMVVYQVKEISFGLTVWKMDKLFCNTKDCLVELRPKKLQMDINSILSLLRMQIYR